MPGGAGVRDREGQGEDREEIREVDVEVHYIGKWVGVGVHDDPENLQQAPQAALQYLCWPVCVRSLSARRDPSCVQTPEDRHRGTHGLGVSIGGRMGPGDRYRGSTKYHAWYLVGPSPVLQPDDLLSVGLNGLPATPFCPRASRGVGYHWAL